MKLLFKRKNSVFRTKLFIYRRDNILIKKNTIPTNVEELLLVFRPPHATSCSPDQQQPSLIMPIFV